MGKKDQQQQEELLKTLGDFTSKENWNKFFSIRGTDDSLEWYAEWPQLRGPLLSHLSDKETPSPLQDASTSSTTTTGAQILVPGCGNSLLSEHLYDAGFRDVTIRLANHMISRGNDHRASRRARSASNRSTRSTTLEH